MTEVHIGGHDYRIGKLNAMDSFLICRKLAIVLINNSVLIPTEEKTEEQLDRDFARVVCAVGSGVPTVDINEAVMTCLRVVQRQEGSAWAQVRGPNNRLMFEDIELKDLLALLRRVLIANNLADFFKESSPTTGGAAS